MSIDEKEGTALKDGALSELKQDEASRKRFLKMMGGTGAAGALAIFIAACGDDDEESGSGETTGASEGGGSDTKGDLEIVNYALTLEYLEAQFYADVIASGEIKDKKLGEIAKSFGENEQEHVDALKATAKQLGKPAAKPKASFDDVIAGGPESILKAAADVENLGAAAYLGQAGRIKSKDVLAAALSIHTVEARHAAALNAAAGRSYKAEGGQGSIPDGAFAKPMSMDEVLEAVQPFLVS